MNRKNFFKMVAAVIPAAMLLFGSAHADVSPGPVPVTQNVDGIVVLPLPGAAAGGFTRTDTTVSVTVKNTNTSGNAIRVSLGTYVLNGPYSSSTNVPNGEQLFLQTLFSFDSVLLGPGQQAKLVALRPPGGCEQDDVFAGILPIAMFLPYAGDGTVQSPAQVAQYSPYLVSGQLVIENGGCDGGTPQEGRMTGGGSIFTSAGVRVTHGFQLHCDVNDPRQSLEVNSGGNRFHLESITSIRCGQLEDGSYQITGIGTGRYNGESGFDVVFTFTDAGEPGKIGDVASVIISKGNLVVPILVTNVLDSGNQQWHPK